MGLALLSFSRQTGLGFTVLLVIVRARLRRAGSEPPAKNPLTCVELLLPRRTVGDAQGVLELHPPSGRREPDTEVGVVFENGVATERRNLLNLAERNDALKLEPCRLRRRNFIHTARAPPPSKLQEA